MICILKALAVWVILLLVGTNLLGFVVRGLMWQAPKSDAPGDEVCDLLAGEVRRHGIANIVMTSTSVLITFGYLAALYHFWNVLLVIAAILAMLTRLPDLLWEIRMGHKVTWQKRQRGPVYELATLGAWVCLPLTWFALCG